VRFFSNPAQRVLFFAHQAVELPISSMASDSFFNYLYRKCFVTFLRLISWLAILGPSRRDAKLASQELFAHNIRRERIQIPTRDTGRDITAYLYIPPGHEKDPTYPEKPRPIVLNWHSSGFIMPVLGSDARMCIGIARKGIIVLDGDYRKAPETTFPGALYDVEDTLKWVASHPERFDLSRVGLCGGSAGGNLALVASSVMRKSLETTLSIKIPAVVVIYPYTDLFAPGGQPVSDPDPIMQPSLLRFLADCYAPDEKIRTDPRVSPSLADPDSYPQTVGIITCARDPLSHGGNTLARKLQNGKRVVVHKMIENARHGFNKGPGEGTNDWYETEAMNALVAGTFSEAFAS
jgi:acetyl esterase/lipase